MMCLPEKPVQHASVLNIKGRISMMELKLDTKILAQMELQCCDVCAAM